MKKEIKANEIQAEMIFSNDMECVSARVVEHNEGRNQWANGFWIWFNGIVVHSAKTKKGIVKKLNQLINDHDLELIDPTTEDEFNPIDVSEWMNAQAGIDNN